MTREGTTRLERSQGTGEHHSPASAVASRLYDDKPYSATRGDYPYDRGKHVIVIVELESFVDESGIEPDQGYCVMAGYVTDAHNWPRFRDEWDAEIDRWGFTEFKAKDFFTFGRGHRYRSGEYGEKKWRRIDERADGHLDRLLTIIEGHNVLATGLAVSWDTVRSLSEDAQHRLMDGERQSPYYLLMSSLIARTLAACAGLRDEDVRLHFIFDRQKMLSERAIGAFNAAMDDSIAQGWLAPRKLGRIAFAESDQTAQLQAADLLCYAWRRVLVEGPGSALANVHRRACKGRMQDLYVWGADQLRELLRLMSGSHTAGEHHAR